MTDAEAIEGVLGLLNGPEKWCKWRSSSIDNNGNKSYCLGGALSQVLYGKSSIWGYRIEDHGYVRDPQWFSLAEKMDANVRDQGYEGFGVGEAFVQFNNAPEIEYEDIRMLLKEVLEVVE